MKKHQKNQKTIQKQKQQEKQKNKLQSQTNNIKNNHKSIQENRFKKMHYDPKFVSPDIKHNKIKIDSRFSKMITDPRFSISNTKDKYGRSISNNKNKNGDAANNQQLKDYYYMDDQQIKQINNQVQQQQEEVNSHNDEQFQSQSDQQQQIGGDDQNESQQQDQQQENNQNNQQQEEDNIKNWMKNYDQQSSSYEQDQQNAYAILDQQAQQQEDDQLSVWSQQKQVIKNQKVPITKRLALCNYDWMSISAKDLILLFNSFKSKQGVITSVQVFQSDYGKQRMQQQATQGPKSLFDDQGQQITERSKLVKEQQQDIIKKNKSRKSIENQRQELQQIQKIDSKRLRAYEKDRLKYFYAIITCSHKSVASSIYDTCDGQQFQNSNLTMDLRYVPDQLALPMDQLHDQCYQVPTSGQVKQNINRAVGHSKVTLTWQDPELTKIASLKRKNWDKMKDQDLDKINWGAYVDDQELEQEDQIDQLVTKNDKSKKNKSSKKNNDIQINFQDQVMKEDQQQESMDSEIQEVDWRKQFNKKGKRKNDDIQITFDTGFNSKMASLKSNSSSINQKLVSLNQQKKQKISFKEKIKRKQFEKKQRKEDQINKARQQLGLLVDPRDKQDFKFNAQDTRFMNTIYNNPQYAIDQTDPRFDHTRIGNVFEAVVKKNKTKSRS